MIKNPEDKVGGKGGLEIGKVLVTAGHYITAEDKKTAKDFDAA